MASSCTPCPPQALCTATWPQAWLERMLTECPSYGRPTGAPLQSWAVNSGRSTRDATRCCLLGAGGWHTVRCATRRARRAPSQQRCVLRLSGRRRREESAAAQMDSRLLDAARTGDLEAVRAALDRGAEVACVNKVRLLAWVRAVPLSPRAARLTVWTVNPGPRACAAAHAWRYVSETRSGGRTAAVAVCARSVSVADCRHKRSALWGLAAKSRRRARNDARIAFSGPGRALECIRTRWCKIQAHFVSAHASRAGCSTKMAHAGRGTTHSARRACKQACWERPCSCAALGVCGGRASNGRA